MRLSPKMLKLVLLAFVGLVCVPALGGCARSIGQPISADAVQKLTPGKTTFADVVRQFGKPSRVRGHGSDTVAQWQYLKDRSGGTNYDSLRIEFDKDGRMVRLVEWLDSGEES